VIRKWKIEDVVEVGCGSGYLGWQIEFLIKEISKQSKGMCYPFPYAGYELQSYRGSVISDYLERSIIKNKDPKDFSYLKQWVKYGPTTLFLSYVQPESSECTMGVDALTTYCRFCKEYGKLPTLFLISDGDLTDGPQFRTILATYFKKISGCSMKGHIGAESPVIEFYEGRKGAFDTTHGCFL
jgi:hypothetical protein